MPRQAGRPFARLSEYAMVVVLLGLCAFFSFMTIDDMYITGGEAGRQVATAIQQQADAATPVLVIIRSRAEEQTFAAAVTDQLEASGYTVRTIEGSPGEVAAELRTLGEAGETELVIACPQVVANWGVLRDLEQRFEGITSATVVSPRSYRWPRFLTVSNLMNVANQIAVFAIIAIGMTLVIITAGIDLSVGSLVALAAVVTALAIQAMGGNEATTTALLIGCGAGVLACAAIGMFSGAMVTFFAVPPFIVTLAMMMVGSGLAYKLSQGQSIADLPTSFQWLGRGADLGLPNAVVLMLVLYVIAHVMMTRTSIGRYIYAVGGNIEAARLSGVPVKLILLLVYTASGALAGLGGVVLASQLNAGAPTYGFMYELYVIAVVVVGGTSLAGGQGNIIGTLIGAFIIAVIRNGMNLMGLESYDQRIVLGLLILAAVLADALRRRGLPALGIKRLLPRNHTQAPVAAGVADDPDDERA